MRLAPAPIADEIRELAELMGPALREADMRIELRLEDVMVVCDITRVRQALLALLDNARRYATPGRVLVAARIADGALHLAVEDDGPGLKDELVAHVFEAFQRGDDSRARASGGSGLGLAVVRAIAQAHGGRASYRRADNGGAIFSISFPTCGVPAHKNSPANPPYVPLGIVASPPRGEPPASRRAPCRGTANDRH